MAWPCVKGTIILKAKNPSEEDCALAYAAEILRNGGLVAFPTETVYGLGANALNLQAVKEIYRVKKRPPDNPLIVHITGIEQARDLVCSIPREAVLLAEKFWPGPLTLVLAKKKHVPDIITAGLSSVAVRVPAHPLALKLMAKAGIPLAAPSANLSGHPSPTTAGHVLDDMAGSIDAVLDGGSCSIGVESTVLSFLSDPPALLRPGGITLEMLQDVLQSKVMDFARRQQSKDFKGTPSSPGMKYRHYAPQTPLYLVEGEGADQRRKLADLNKKLAQEGYKVGLILFEESRDFYAAPVIKVLSSKKDPCLAAERLFAVLRSKDFLDVDVIIAEGLEEKEIGHAVMNRLRKAATKIIVP
ncbi:MAG: threonylcarbamoyl-AMP synthase [Firmicutes bacterium]|nr:threonylcarbamoyl-AMP synthase [Bacillota bacterium]